MVVEIQKKLHMICDDDDCSRVLLFARFLDNVLVRYLVSWSPSIMCMSLFSSGLITGTVDVTHIIKCVT